jgi:hypothetical protein
MAEGKAQKFWQKAEEALASGDVATAKANYEKIIALGDTTKKADAEKKLEELPK